MWVKDLAQRNYRIYCTDATQAALLRARLPEEACSTGGNVMPRIQISSQTRDHIQAFLALGDQLQGEQMTLDLCAESLILLGIRAVLDGLWRPHDTDIHVQTLHQLAAAYPQQVLPFLAYVLQEGERIRPEAAGAPFGFHPQPDGNLPSP